MSTVAIHDDCDIVVFGNSNGGICAIDRYRYPSKARGMYEVISECGGDGRFPKVRYVSNPNSYNYRVRDKCRVKTYLVTLRTWKFWTPYWTGELIVLWTGRAHYEPSIETWFVYPKITRKLYSKEDWQMIQI